MTTTVTIARRYRGPLDSGNGGYSAGSLARHVDADSVEVTLRLPPPLDRPLAVERRGELTLLLDGEAVVAEARPAELDLEAPRPVSWDEAVAARERFEPLRVVQFRECFTCGTRREGDDHLAIHAGAVEGRPGVVASSWVAREASFEVVWAAIDCPGAYALAPAERGEVVLGRMTARVLRLPAEGERTVAAGFALGEDGRKLHAATVLYGESGDVCALARQVWIVPRGG